VLHKGFWRGVLQWAAGKTYPGIGPLPGLFASASGRPLQCGLGLADCCGIMTNLNHTMMRMDQIMQTCRCKGEGRGNDRIPTHALQIGYRLGQSAGETKNRLVSGFITQ
jgi:hypothetical protein